MRKCCLPALLLAFVFIATSASLIGLTGFGVSNWIVLDFFPEGEPEGQFVDIGTDVMTDLFEGTHVTLEFGSVLAGGYVTVKYYPIKPANSEFDGAEPTNVSSYYWEITCDEDFSFENGRIHVIASSLPGVNTSQLLSDEQNLDAGIIIFKRAGVGQNFFNLTTHYDTPPALPEMLSAPIGDSFSEFVLGSNNAIQTLPVELSSFTAGVTTNGFVELEWVSETETNMLGYNIYRANKDILATATSVNTQIIQATNSSYMMEYTFIDETVLPDNFYFYWLQVVDLDLTHSFYGPTSVQVSDDIEDGSIVPEDVITKLIGAYPNPFNPGTSIHFSLDKKTKVSISIYNNRGQLIRNLIADREFDEKSKHSVYWEGTDNKGKSVSSGIYLFIMETADGFTSNKKMLMLK